MSADFSPRWPYCITGDGHVIQIRAKSERFNEEGVEGYEVVINPSREVIEEYGLKKEDFDENGFIVRWYPKTVFRALREDPVKGMYFLYTDINGQETSFSRAIVEYREVIEAQQKHIHVLKARNAALWHELKLMTSQQLQYMRKNVELVKVAKSLETGLGDMGTEEASNEMPG